MPASLMNNYKLLPVQFQRGEGAWIWDTEGVKYLDALCGIAVTGLGHAHPEVTQAICEQASQLLHTSNLYGIQNQQKLADKLIEISGMEKAFFGNSGAEANEAAIKIARLYGHNKNITQPAIIVTDNSFHGRTLATLSATGNRKIQAGFEPLVQGFLRVPFDDVDAIAAIAKNNSDVVAVMIEPIQGEGGINIPDSSYLAKIRQICDDNDWLMILDEIQTGMGRTGRWFAYQHHNLLPDIVTIAKALGNGLPIGACLAKGVAAETFQPGNHGTTCGGNPLVCRTALSVINVIEKSDLVARAETLGKSMLTQFKEQLGDLPQVQEIRGMGLLLAIELSKPCAALIQKALADNLLINVTAETVIRLLPPLILTDEQSELIVDKVSNLVRGFS